MKNNDFYVLSQLSDKLKKHEFICEIKSKYGRPHLDFDTWEVPYQTVLGMLISVEGNSLKLEFVNFRAVKGVTNDFEDDDCSNRVQATAYCDAFEMVASRGSYHIAVKTAIFDRYGFII